jgi:LytS/YehU family sensor histidine kinase
LAGLTGIIYINRKKLDRERRQQTLKLQALQMEQKLLRLQMNPHFIFNALNSILSFVIENDTKEANQYLSRFSLLMQSILKQTEQEYISLEQELITLNLYAELEQLRFDNKFEFEIACQAEIDQQNTMIPPLIIQPFVENAIVHGIRHKNGPGKVFVNIAIDEDVLKIVVEDDGVGRLKAQQIKKKSGKTFRSLALELVKRRLERISTPTVKANYEIEDANPDNPENSGTKVKMYLPIFSAPNKTTNANNKLLDSISI